MMYSREVAEARHRELMDEASRRALHREARCASAPQRSGAVSRFLATWLRRTADRLDAGSTAARTEGCTTC